MKLFFALFLTVAAVAHGQDLHVAVASNFKPSLTILAKTFAEQTGHRLLISSASTGALYNQIINGAPFDVFLAADSLRPAQLEQQGLGERRSTYAFGELVFWRPGVKKPVNLTDYRGRLAIANPATAPYGLAAQQVLEKLHLWQPIQPRLVQGSSVQQAWQFVASGNAPAGLVARAQLANEKNNTNIITIPTELYAPIRQDLIILKRSKKPELAKVLVEFLLSMPVQNMIVSQGYLPASCYNKGTPEC